MTQKLKIDIVAKDKSKQALNGVRGGLTRLKKSVFSLQTAFIGLGAGLAIRSLINTGKQIEGLQVRLKFLFGTAEEGAKAFEAMAKFAAKVPFSLEEIQQGAGVLAVVSKDAKEMAKLMEITGNVAAVTGLDFKTTSEQIQRSMSAGISAADLFRDKGVKDMRGFKAGATVSIEETTAAFEKVFGKGGRFGKATDELANTLGGTLSMIGDKIFAFKKTLLDAGFFQELKNQFGIRTIQEAISGEREEIMAELEAKAQLVATELGIELVDVRVSRIELPEDVSESVYQRMRAERSRTAKDFRARGKETAENIKAQADKKRTVIIAEAYRTSQQEKGSGDAKSTAIYANAYNQDAEFYAFTRSLQAYANSFKSKSDMLVIDPDSDFFKYFKNIK